MNNSFQNNISTNLQKTDVIDKICGNLGNKCKIKIRSILGIEVENELITNGLLCDLLHGRLVITEHTSEYDPYSHYDCKGEYNGKTCFIEVKSTFSKLGAYAQMRDSVDTLVMNNAQYAALQKINDTGELVLLACYYYLDNVVLLINFRGIKKITSTSDIQDANGEKTFYSFDSTAIIKKLENVMSKTFRPKIRTLQYDQIAKHIAQCTHDRCVVKRHSI